MKEIKILGTSCKKCIALEQRVKDLVLENNIDARVEKISDINQMIDYGIMMTPALIVNEEIKSVGIIPKDAEILNWLRE